jgi:hypothetical protein
MRTVEQINKELASIDRMSEVLYQYSGSGTTSADWRNLDAWKAELLEELETAEKNKKEQ